MIVTLIVLEHDGRRVKRSSLSAIAPARQLGGDCALVVLGRHLDRIAASVQGFGAAKVIIADHANLAEPLVDRYAADG